MELKNQKLLAAKVLKCSAKHIRFDSTRLEDIKEAITRIDIHSLISDKAIYALPIKSASKYHARKAKIQKRKGRRSGQGSRKGKANARLNKKRSWIATIRLQRKFIKELKDKSLIDAKTFKDLYAKSSGGFFRSKRHIKLYLEEHGLIKKKKK